MRTPVSRSHTSWVWGTPKIERNRLGATSRKIPSAKRYRANTNRLLAALLIVPPSLAAGDPRLDRRTIGGFASLRGAVAFETKKLSATVERSRGAGCGRDRFE